MRVTGCSVLDQPLIVVIIRSSALEQVGFCFGGHKSPWRETVGLFPLLSD